jgi:hypothetical protein
MSWQDPEVIWLQPWCQKCKKEVDEGRMWCVDNVWDQCDLCERKPVQYKMVKRAGRVGHKETGRD